MCTIYVGNYASLNQKMLLVHWTDEHALNWCTYLLTLQHFTYMKSSSGFIVMFETIIFLDYGTVVLTPTLGKELLMFLREFMVEEMGKFLIDPHFTPHLTLFINGNLEFQEKEQLSKSFRHYRLESLAVKFCTLRTKKKWHIKVVGSTPSGID